jgi:hypothetical protein
MGHRWAEIARELQSLLKLNTAPLAITFSMEAPEGISPYSGHVPKPARHAYQNGIAVGSDMGDLQTVKEMRVFLRRLEPS